MLTPPIKPNERKAVIDVPPHPLKDELQALGYRQGQLCVWLTEKLGRQVYQPQISVWLAGFQPMPADVEEALAALVGESGKN